jgi:hypothetical protein
MNSCIKPNKKEETESKNKNLIRTQVEVKVEAALLLNLISDGNLLVIGL